MSYLPETIKSWMPQQKLMVLLAIKDGSLSFEEARRRYELSQEELTRWGELYAAHGIKGLTAKFRKKPRIAARQARDEENRL